MNTFRSRLSILATISAAAFLGGCSDPSDTASGPKESSSESKAIVGAAASATNAEDALNLAATAASREDISAADREAALKAQQEALKKLGEAAAAGDANAQEVINRYRGSR